MKKKKKIILSGILVFILFMVGSYFYNNITYIENPLKKCIELDLLKNK